MGFCGDEKHRQSGGTAGADISATDAWDVRTDASDVVVAVLDTGVHYGHEDLAANMWDGAALGFPNHGWNFVDNTDDPYDIDGHGTHCAGTIGAAGNNAKGVAGVAWNVKIMAVKILNDLGSGTTDMALGGYEWVLARKNAGVNIVAINASYGGDPYSQIEENAIAALGDAGILRAAAGIMVSIMMLTQIIRHPTTSLISFVAPPTETTIQPLSRRRSYNSERSVHPQPGARFVYGAGCNN